MERSLRHGTKRKLRGEAADEDGLGEARRERGRNRDGEEELVGEPVFDGLPKNELKDCSSLEVIVHWRRARELDGEEEEEEVEARFLNKGTHWLL